MKKVFSFITRLYMIFNNRVKTPKLDPEKRRSFTISVASSLYKILW